MHHGNSAREDEAPVIGLWGRSQPEIVPAAVDLDDLNSPHTLAVLAVPPGSTVLDVGCGQGVVARALAARGCRVWGVEIDPRRAAVARNYCVEVLEADIEDVTFSTAFAGMAFDAVLFLDVLEHLRNPQAPLVDAAAVLAPGGSVLLSVPNVTHGALRLELLSGRFRYRASGLLDQGHLRFFDAQGVDELIRQAGFHTDTRLRVIRRLDQTEFDIDLPNVPNALRNALESDPHALTYQFFVIARPVRGGQPAIEGMTLLERQRARIDELAEAVEKGAAYARHLQEELAAKDSRLREMEAAAHNAERARFEALTAAVEQGGAYAAHLREELAASTTRLGEAEEALRTLERESADRTSRLVEIQRAHDDARQELDMRTARLRDVEAAVEDGARELAARDARLAAMEQLVADLTRLSEDSDSYVRHLEAELRHRAGDIAIRDDELSVVRAHIEKVENAIGERCREVAARDAELGPLRARLAEAERSLADREASLQIAERSLQIAERQVVETQEIVARLTAVLQQPRHRLAERGNTALKRWTPILHRLLRALVASPPHGAPTAHPAQPDRGAD